MTTFYNDRSERRQIAAYTALCLFGIIVTALSVAGLYEARIPRNTGDCPRGHEYVAESNITEPGCYPLPVADLVRDGVIGNG